MSRRRAINVWVVLILFLTTSGASAQIEWRSGASLSRAGSRAQALDVIGSPGAGGARRHIVVVFDKAITPAIRSDLKAVGLELQSYLGNHAYFAVVNPEHLDRQRIANVDALIDAMDVLPQWKMHPVLARGDTPDWAVVPSPAAHAADLGDQADPWIAAYLLFHRDVDANDAESAVQKHGAVIRRRLATVNGMVIELPLRAVNALAAEDTTQYIEPALPPLDAVNDSNRAITGADIVQAPPYDLDGAGVSVLVYDAGTARASHVDFEGRLTTHDASGLSDHATHVSGTIGGAGIGNPAVRGMAPGVTIESYGFQQVGGLQAGFLYTDPGDLETDYGEAIGVYGADIANNSIGTNTASNGFPCDWEGDYGVTSTVIDAIVRGGLGEPFRIVWANGNERGSGRCGSAYHTTAPPACAKNHITVGALNSNDDSMTYFSSWGPTDDDRLKPDISAPGCQSGGDNGVTSCSGSSDTAYVTYCGTSMASPTVCGLSALLLQDYRASHPGAPDFRNSTLKALLAHNAEDVEEVGPDYRSGYGSVRIQQTIDFMRTGSFVTGEVDQDEVIQLVVVVSQGDASLKATLAWDDPPGTPNVSPALVNDLDVRAFAPNGQQYFPWTLGGQANPAAPAVRTQPDRTNNIEQVVVDAPTPGIWRVEIHGFNVPEGPQPFSVCVSPDLSPDCNGNGVDDLQDIANGTSPDCNENNIPDECEPNEDCNANGVTDICDIGGGSSQDVNANRIPDECEPDCNGNGVPDDHDIAIGSVADCNVNGVPDECDISMGGSIDCAGNGIPDECETDCNGNGISDDCDVDSGTSLDCNGNLLPDECEVDCNGNGVPDD
ncbi:MAG: S8 family serine peptidase, partial [Phycisphaerales bacterium]|nr:S8 family serine peptidase [Phycisphaerales bacterium]